MGKCALNGTEEFVCCGYKHALTLLKEAISLVGLEGKHADMNCKVEVSGQGWSQGEKQLVSGRATAFCCLTILFHHYFSPHVGVLVSRSVEETFPVVLGRGALASA